MSLARLDIYGRYPIAKPWGWEITQFSSAAELSLQLVRPTQLEVEWRPRVVAEEHRVWGIIFTVLVQEAETLERSKGLANVHNQVHCLTPFIMGWERILACEG